MNATATQRDTVEMLDTDADLQRRAYNLAFAATGLDWYWDARTYAELDADQDGAARVAAFAEHLGETVDAAEVQSMQTLIASRLMRRFQTVPGDHHPHQQQFAAE